MPGAQDQPGGILPVAAEELRLDSQSPNNYTYDANGNLTGGVSEGLTMYWKNYGKLDSLKNDNKSLAMKFRYDPMGNRIEKRLYHLDGTGAVVRQRATHYVRDAQGNPLAVYELLGGDTVVLNEFNLYGSNRLGMLTTADTLVCTTCTTAVAPSVYLSPVGMKRYELSNHLGNVMTVISVKITTVDTTNDGLWDYFNPSLVSATDYYPFGMGMPGRGIDRDQYKYGFNGQENEYEISDYGNYTTATFWQYDLRLSVRWNLDPVLHAWESGFSVLGRNPILNTDPLGDDWFKDKSGTRQFDPSVKPESKLGEGEVYIGVTDFEITKRGTASYRVDGSILYSDQTDGYKRVWENSKANTKGSEKEQFALILEKGVLVTPDYRNESTESSPVQYGYNFKAERVFDPVSKSYLNIVGTIHSHPLNLGEGSQRPSVWGPYGSDVLTHTSNFPNKPFLTMGWDRKIYGAVGNKDGWSPIEFPPEIKTIDQLLRGYDLRKLILSNQPR